MPGVERIALRSVVLDPGHGGNDSGAVGPGGLREKDVALSVALTLKGLLEKQGVKVIMTRSDDRFIPLLDRSAVANRSGADAFLSIHCNAARDRSAAGAETFALSTGISDTYRAGRAAARLRPSDLVDGASDRVSSSTEKAILSAHLSEQRRQSLALASALQAEMIRTLDETDRGVKLRNFSVLRETYIPAALAEIGFISHWSTERRLRSADYRRKVAEALACGLTNYARSEAARLGRISGTTPGADRPGVEKLAAEQEPAARTRVAHRSSSARR
jgi:N-acetylmuramoyl-L-alanine amidase